MADTPATTPPIASWRGNIPIHHRYTLGVAGERFFRALRDDKQILASRCPRCGDRFLLPKLYCERCFVETDRWSAVEGPGRVVTFTLLHLTLDEEPLDPPTAVALIGWEGVRGGVIHRVGGVDPARVAVGMAVAPRWAQVRTGGINDIEYFEPV